MDYQKKITVCGTKYTIELCSAEQQWRILRLFSRYGLTEVLSALALGSKELAVGAIFGSFSAKATDDEIDEVSEMLIGRIVNDKGEIVSVDDFHCNMLAYSELHLEALKANFGDFSEFLALHSPSAQEQKGKESQK